MTTTNGYEEIDYRDACWRIAQEAVRAAHDDDVDLETYIHESVDGSEWVIYYGRAHAVCGWSENADAIVDELGIDAFAGAVSLAECHQRAAYWAMLADVREACDEASDELRSEVDDAVADFRAPICEEGLDTGGEA
jgi:hypothetical protein